MDVIHAGASDFIKKPFDLEELEAKVSRIIGERSLRQELNRLSMTDSLTGLFNHRQFFERLREEMVRASRQREPLSIVLFDLDDFKAYNDTHGHLAGDEVLRDVGGIILKCIREGVDTGVSLRWRRIRRHPDRRDHGGSPHHCPSNGKEL